MFKKIVGDGGTVRAFVVANAAGYSRSAVDGIVNGEKAQGRHLLWARRAEDGTVTSSFPKAVGEETVRALLDATGTGNGQLAFVVAGEPDTTSKTLGALRVAIAKKDNLLDPEQFGDVWAGCRYCRYWMAVVEHFVMRQEIHRHVVRVHRQLAHRHDTGLEFRKVRTGENGFHSG